MTQKIRLSDMGLSDLQIGHLLDKYNVSFDMNLTVGDNVYLYLNSKNGFIQHKRQAVLPKEMQALYQEALRNVVAKGSPIIIYISSFSPKIPNPNITNHQLLPDMGDLLTLVHLHLLAKHIRSFYDYGFRFIIGYKGTLYQPILGWDDATVHQTFHILKELIAHAERITGTRNVIEFVDFMDLAKKEGDYFSIQWEEEQGNVRKRYEEKEEATVRKINGWIRDYQKAIDVTRFRDEEQMHGFLLEKAVYIRALKNIQFIGGAKNLGICNSLPPTLRTSTRGIDPSISLQINPYFRFHSHQRLLRLDDANRQWETFEWKENGHVLQPVLTEEYGYPFYYERKEKS